MESDSLGSWVNSASVSGLQVTETTMEHHNRSPESARPNRRQFVLTGGSTVAAGVIAHSGRLINQFTSPQPYKKESKMKDTKPSIVFCHGIWADGSCFSKVIPALQAEGHQCIAAQYSLNTTADDIAIVKRALGRVSSPAILVGHSYGGSVITGAGTDDRVAGLVYIAAFAPDADETSDTQRPSSRRQTSSRTSKSRMDVSGCFRKASNPSQATCPSRKRSSLGRPNACRLQTCSRRKREERRGGRSQAGTSSPRTTAPYSLTVSASSPSAWAPRRRKWRAATW